MQGWGAWGGRAVCVSLWGKVSAAYSRRSRLSRACVHPLFLGISATLSHLPTPRARCRCVFFVCLVVPGPGGCSVPKRRPAGCGPCDGVPTPATRPWRPVPQHRKHCDPPRVRESAMCTRRMRRGPARGWPGASMPLHALCHGVRLRCSPRGLQPFAVCGVVCDAQVRVWLLCVLWRGH